MNFTICHPQLFDLAKGIRILLSPLKNGYFQGYSKHDQIVSIVEILNIIKSINVPWNPTNIPSGIAKSFVNCFRYPPRKLRSKIDVKIHGSWETAGFPHLAVCLYLVYLRDTLCSMDQWELQDPKMEVLYHIRPYFMGIFPYIGLI